MGRPNTPPRQGLHLHLDCGSGIAGDMFLAALLDLGVPVHAVEQPLSAMGLALPAFKTHAVKRRGLAALHVTVPEASGTQQRQVRHEEMRNRVEQAELSPPLSTRVLSVLDRLASAEARVHGVSPEKVHYHELGGVDTLTDVAGVCAALDWLAPISVSASPVALGGGQVSTDHGWLPVPAPATLELLKGVPVQGGPDPETELTTPTGAALLTTVADRYGVLPPMVVECVGCGAGARDLADRPNILRVIAGRPTTKETVAGPRQDVGTVVELRANVDDMAGELTAHAVARLMESGALDAWIEPVQMKKGRPGWVICALARGHDLEAMIQCYLAETTTFGVRWHTTTRHVMSRRAVPVETPFGIVDVMVASHANGTPKMSPEFESCLQAARQAGVPLREVYRQVEAAWRKKQNKVESP